eukprot:1195876-Prorocentrum_minimum.AAC.3
MAPRRRVTQVRLRVPLVRLRVALVRTGMDSLSTRSSTRPTSSPLRGSNEFMAAGMMRRTNPFSGCRVALDPGLPRARVVDGAVGVVGEPRWHAPRPRRCGGRSSACGGGWSAGSWSGSRGWAR